jgi:hypothetical protein
MRTVIGLSLVALLSSVMVIEAQASSCQAMFSQCAARCANNAKGEPQAKCTADHCRPKLATCQSSGCWTEGAAYGGGRTCNLKKS